jgi:uncharacterized protein YggU (UPF0235/DUF167 family)
VTYDPTKVKVDPGHVRRETDAERIQRQLRQSPNNGQANDYEIARLAGKVTYYRRTR